MPDSSIDVGPAHDLLGAEIEDIIYIDREGRRTAVHLISGKVIHTYMSLKDIKSRIPEDGFLHINKGTIVSKRHIVSIDHGAYTMVDGVTLAGRVRTPGEHNSNKEMLKNTRRASTKDGELKGLCNAFYDVPAHFSIMQLTYDENGHGMDIIVRYLNRIAQESIGSRTAVGKSFMEVFPDADKGWLLTLANVAINGDVKTVVSYSRDRDKHMVARCFRPVDRYVAIITTELNNLERI